MIRGGVDFGLCPAMLLGVDGAALWLVAVGAPKIWRLFLLLATTAARASGSTSKEGSRQSSRNFAANGPRAVHGRRRGVVRSSALR